MMRILGCFLLIIISAANVQAATVTFADYTFETYIISDSPPSGRLYEFWEGRHWVLRVREGQEYSIIVRNPMPVRVAVALTVDGLNTIDGRHTKPADGRKWIIEPFQAITIGGWQTGADGSRKFFFTRPDKSYAQWKENRDQRSYTKNLGVIGIAYFWSSQELYQALHPPQPFAERESAPMKQERRLSAQKRNKSGDDQAGTGMGRKVYHPVKKVHFDFDTGMYSNRDVLKIFYRFDRNAITPQPFINERKRQQQEEFAPEMPQN
ncbi:hypothetical protein QUF90_12425 [Desulfococcaceae bacterium HSG9]|nr:hypothetical protein [Desulfococcaceae bacterium HSG9]